MKSVAKRITLTLAAVAVTASLAGCGVNAIPTKEEAAKAQWAEVQNQYKRRADLVPQLVNTVKGAAAQEKSVLIGVTEARAKATSINVDPSKVPDAAKLAEYDKAQGALGSALGRLLMVKEAYPDLKTNANFLGLQHQLEGTENRIARARSDYNKAVQDYNTTLRVFPTSIWAHTFYSGSKAMPLFSAPAGSDNAPTVDFNTTPAPAPTSAKP
jgi:LemA protein